MKKVLVLVMMVTVFTGCRERMAEEITETLFYFEEPQPANDSEIHRFPDKFQGVYEDGTNVAYHISERAIYYQYTEIDTITRSLMDSLKASGFYKEGRVVLDEKYGVYDVQEKGNYYYLSRLRKDTAFVFSDSAKVKRINGNLVLNIRDSIFWKSVIISLKNDSLTWKQLATKEDFVNLRPLVKNIQVNSDTTVVYLKPKRKEFAKMLKLKKLDWQHNYKKVK